MFDKILGIGSMFDWITPLASIVQDVRGKTVIVVTDDFANIGKLKRAGIKCKRISWNALQRCWVFDVQKCDAQRAADILGVEYRK